MPDKAEFFSLISDLWESEWITNNGELVQSLEETLCEYLGHGNLSLYQNATLGLVAALKSLDVTGEVITTPYSFVATSHAIHHLGLKPVFVDIESDSFNIDPSEIERAITTKTSALMPVHIYGQPCDVNAIQAIAEKQGLKVIYDAAHCFGVEYRGETVLAHGDASVVSLHATKAFSTIEGGIIACRDSNLKNRLDLWKNFGIAGETSVLCCGLNGKMNEFQAAFGLSSLSKFDSSVKHRKLIDSTYRDYLRNIDWIRILPIRQDVDANYSYFPILVTEDAPLERDALHEYLCSKGIFTRRYFYPLIPEFPPYCSEKIDVRLSFPNAYKVSRQILCLPIHHGISVEHAARIGGMLAEV